MKGNIDITTNGYWYDDKSYLKHLEWQVIRLKLDKILFVIFLVILSILLVKYLINKYNKEVCYNMPFHQFVEDTRCNKYSINDFLNH